jgi:2-polyprenyl-6-methoxyphenol hydroxylase-like FAD-dependent oxidoreductase
MTDVLIIGSGPAGLSAAIVLRSLGKKVSLITRSKSAQRTVGESLAGSAQYALRELGVWDTFMEAGHLPSYSNASAWGTDTLYYNDFIRSMQGHAWHIDRDQFEAMLYKRAIEEGVQLTETNNRFQLEAYPDGWYLITESSIEPEAFRFVIDASGRNSWLARQLGISRIVEDEQVALYGFLSSEKNILEDSSSLVEAVESGWWYSALLPDGQLAVAFFTDADLHDWKALSTEDGWMAALLQTSYTAHRIQQYGYLLNGMLRSTAANSSRLPVIQGEHWLAIGDAAMSFDPLSSHGISLALISGIDGAKAVSAAIDGTSNPFGFYFEAMQKGGDIYRRQRQALYLQEQRWKTAPYWKRRQSPGR